MYSNAFVVYMTKQHKKHYDKQRDTMRNNERHTETDMQQDNKIGRRKATSERREKKRREKGPKAWQERKCISFRTLCCATKLVDVHVHGTKYLCIYIYILHKHKYRDTHGCNSVFHKWSSSMAFSCGSTRPRCVSVKKKGSFKRIQRFLSDGSLPQKTTLRPQ